ncbi:MAG: tRNA pseudouridine(13) synthase TruD, partial [Candidatus Bathyarchaeia archaeon]
SSAVLDKSEIQVLGSSMLIDRFLLCVLVKRGWDTFLALKAVAEQLGISAKRIQIAGIKDAKATTAQYITIENASAGDVQKVKVKDIKIYPLGYLHSKLSSYYLLGNHFRITIRAITHSKSTIEKRIKRTVEELQAIGGAPNFFGHQRFGTIRPITHLVGKAIIQGNFKKAALLFLAKPSPYEHPESKQAREQLLSTQDFKQALKNFPKKLHYERLMLEHLAQKPEDFIGALRRLPTKLLELFPQSYQAYLFNRFLSKRVKKGLNFNKAEVGDYAINVDRCGLPMQNVQKMTNHETLSEINKAIQDGRMRLAIPLVGFKQHLSRGIQGEIEKQILEEERISSENFKIKRIPELSLKGKLRTTVAPLEHFTINEISKYSVNLPKHKVQVSFLLHRGSYATIVLREIMKPRNMIKAGF